MGLFYKIVSFSVLFLVLGIGIIMYLAPHLHWDQHAQIGLFQFWATVVGFGFAGFSLYLTVRGPTLSLVLDPKTKRNFVPVVADGHEHHVDIHVWNSSLIQATHVVVDLTISDKIRGPLGLRFLRTEADLATYSPKRLGTWSIASRHGEVGWIWQGGEVAIPGRAHLPILSLPVKLERRTQPRTNGLEAFFIKYYVWGENTRPRSGRIYIRAVPTPDSSRCS